MIGNRDSQLLWEDCPQFVDNRALELLELSWSPIDRSPIFASIAYMPTHSVCVGNLRHVILSGDFVLLRKNQQVIIWNWRRDAWTAIRTGSGYQGVRMSSLFDLADE
jgi:hypothetical protein